MRRLIVLVLIALLLVGGATAALAGGGVAPFVRPRLERLIDTVETNFGLNCRYMIVENAEQIAVGVLCDK